MATVEFQPSPYVSFRTPLDLNYINQALQAKQQRADDAQTMQSGLMSKLYEFQNYDPELYQQYLGNVREATENVLRANRGDWGAAKMDIMRLIEEARNDPILTLMTQKKEALDKQNSLLQEM